jgi:glycosyltransferase involved in cell wall biosynthesis
MRAVGYQTVTRVTIAPHRQRKHGNRAPGRATRLVLILVRLVETPKRFVGYRRWLTRAEQDVNWQSAAQTVVKLIIQIPCLNEREQLAGTLADLPRQVAGFDEIEVLVVDDGSSDGTFERAIELGVHHVVRFPKRRGLAAAFTAGIDAALRLGADVIVNTDADNQYCGADIAELVAPVVAGRADVAIGNRRTDNVAHFSWMKRMMQRWGSRLVRRASGTRVTDATSGFRAISRAAALRVFVHNRFTYTLETIIQGGHTGVVFEDVDLSQTNQGRRRSRLFGSIPEYLRRNGPVIMRSYVMYRPVRTFAAAALITFLAGAILVARFAYLFLRDPEHSGHIQSLVVGVGCVVLSFLIGMVAMLSDLLSANRRLLEDVLARTRRIDAELAMQAAGRGESIDGIHTTGAAPWREDRLKPLSRHGS